MKEFDPAAEAGDYYWVEAAPFRALLRYLLDATGRSWAELAAIACVPARLTHSLLFGRAGRPLARVPYDYGRRLLALEANLAWQPPTPASPPRLRRWKP